jgi:hypothetical protein
MKGNNWIQHGKRTSLLRTIKDNDDSDERTFHLWKSELQRELPLFWESILS